jgi:hypothetical protein
MNPGKIIKSAMAYFNLRREWLGDGEIPVDPATAQRRADTCLACPKHTSIPFWELLADPIALRARRQIEVKNQMNLRVDGEKSLHVCSVCSCVLRLKVHVPTHVVQAMREPSDIFPENCWIEKEKNEQLNNGHNG